MNLKRIAAFALCVACSVSLACALRKPPALANQTPAGKQTIMVAMRDGIELATDVYIPTGTGPFPVILLRSPYNKDGLAGMGADAQRRGYVLVGQDTRGRFASKGVGLAFGGDGWWDGKQDGYDTCAWIMKQPWCNGKIGTVGGSALGITQLAEAGAGSPGITAQRIDVAAPSQYFDVNYPGGVFKKNMIESWLSVTNHSPQTLEAWTAHPTYDAYWRERDLNLRYDKTNAPAVHTGGWFDIFSQGTIDAFNGMQTKGGQGARRKQKLIMGPWTHGIFQPKAGQLTFKDGAAPPGKVHDTWAWMDHWLKGAANGIEAEPAVTYYVMGDAQTAGAPGNEWRRTDRWPPAGTQDRPLYLASDRTLTWTKPNAGDLRYTYDPANPAPTVGGKQLVLPSGPMEQSAVESRSDVLSYSSPVLDDPIEVTGRARLTLHVSSDCKDTDFFARLCDVYPDGKSYNIAEGQLRARFREGFSKEVPLTPGKAVTLQVDLGSTSVVFNKGHRIRVQVTSSSSPGFDPNPNTGEPFRSSSRTQIATNTVYSGGVRASALLLPFMPTPLPTK
jgi:predicted acyl esterase